MSDTSPAKAFDFSQFVPGFDFLKNLTGPAASGGGGAVPGMPSLSSWIAPTLSVEEVDKRIQELKTVQYWLEQNGHALKATIQALEVQKMTLSTLRGMNVRMEDLANAFTRTAGVVASSVATPAAASAAAPAAPTPAPASSLSSAFRSTPATAPADNGAEQARADRGADVPATDANASNDNDNANGKDKSSGKTGKKADGAAASVIDPMQWWGALTQQFQQIATSALQDAARLGAPPEAGGSKSAKSATSAKAGKAGATDPASAATSSGASTSRQVAARKSPARKAAAKKRPASRR